MRPDWPPRKSAYQLAEGTRGRGSTGQLFEVTNGQWVRIWDELGEAGTFCKPWSRYPMIVKMTPQWATDINQCNPGAHIDDAFVPARPLGYPALRERLRAAWLVFRGQANALVWPRGQ